MRKRYIQGVTIVAFPNRRSDQLPERPAQFVGEEDAAIDCHAVLVRGESPRIITGADVLGKRLKGIKAEDPVAQ